jgi:FixJ family two-component response regulator
VLGLLNKQGAASLGISEVTYQIHRSSIMRKMAARSLADLVRMAIKLGIPTENSGASLRGPSPSGHAEGNPKRTQARIGVIDDDRRVLESLGDLLESAGYSVRLFSSAAAFFETDAVQTVACLICDICMPGMDGWALEHRMAKEQPELSIILITGDEAAWAKGARGLSQAQKRVLLKKPFDKQQLLSAVARTVA